MPECKCINTNSDLLPRRCRFTCGGVLHREAFSCHLCDHQMSILSPSYLKLPQCENVLETTRLEGFYCVVNYLGSASLAIKHYTTKQRICLFKSYFQVKDRLFFCMCVCGGVYVSPMLMQRSTDSHSALVSQGGAFVLLSVFSKLLQLSSVLLSSLKSGFFLFPVHPHTLLIKCFINSIWLRITAGSFAGPLSADKRSAHAVKLLNYLDYIFMPCHPSVMVSVLCSVAPPWQMFIATVSTWYQDNKSLSQQLFAVSVHQMRFNRD